MSVKMNAVSVSFDNGSTRSAVRAAARSKSDDGEIMRW